MCLASQEQERETAPRETGTENHANEGGLEKNLRHTVFHIEFCYLLHTEFTSARLLDYFV